MNIFSLRVEGDAGGAGSEDCLKVNIYAPVGARQGSNRMFLFHRDCRHLPLFLVPVLVYIHGGGT